MSSARPWLSIVIPVLNEAEGIAGALAALQSVRREGAELIVVDGGSSDDTARLAAAGADRVIAASRGRALQMNAGAAHARGEVLLFLHADTRLPRNAVACLREAVSGGGDCWGRFDVSIAGKPPLLSVVAAAMNARSRLTGIATGDQAMFVSRSMFDAVGGFPPIALMEDVALSIRLKGIRRPVCLRDRVRTSGRRWEKHGVLRTILLMWRLRLAYRLGADPDTLVLRYGPHK